MSTKTTTQKPANASKANGKADAKKAAETAKKAAAIAQAKADAKTAAAAKREAEKAAKAAERAPRPCLCGCGVNAGAGARFIPGHDARMHGLARRIAFGTADRDEAMASRDARCQAALAESIAHIGATATKPKSAQRWIALVLRGEDIVLRSKPQTTAAAAERWAAEAMLDMGMTTSIQEA